VAVVILVATVQLLAYTCARQLWAAERRYCAVQARKVLKFLPPALSPLLSQTKNPPGKGSAGGGVQQLFRSGPQDIRWPALTLMNISTSKPLGSYITERELPRTNAARVFELVLPYQVEKSEQSTVFRWRWTYTAEQEAIDLKSGGYACRARHVVEKHAFIRQVLRELRQRGDKLYSVEGQRMPIRGKV